MASHNNFDLLWHGLSYWSDQNYSDLEDVEQEDFPLHSDNFFDEWNPTDLRDANGYVPMMIFNEKDQGQVAVPDQECEDNPNAC